MPGILRQQEPSMVDEYNAMQPGMMNPLQLAIFRHLYLPFMDNISKKTRQKGQLEAEDAAWDAMVNRFNNYPPRPSVLQGINGARVPRGPDEVPVRFPPGIIGERG